MTELINILKSLPAYALELFNNHTILFIITAAVFVFVAFFSNKIADKLRSVFVLAALLLVVFSFISQSWPRIVLIAVSLLALFVCRCIGYAISEIRISRRNKRLAERALEKAAKRRGSWANKQGYSGARKLIVEPEYVPEEMDQDEIDDVIENEISDGKLSDEEAEIDETEEIPETEETEEIEASPKTEKAWGTGNVFKENDTENEDAWGAGNVFKAEPADDEN